LFNWLLVESWCDVENKKTQVLNFRVCPLDALRIRGLAMLNGYSLSELCRGALYRALDDAKENDGVFAIQDASTAGGADEN
jgi:hypothetical protein